MTERQGKLCRTVAAVLFVLLLVGSLVGFVFATKKDVLLALGILVGGGLGSYGVFRGLNALAEAGGQGTAGEGSGEDKKLQKLNKLLDDLCDN